MATTNSTTILGSSVIGLNSDDVKFHGIPLRLAHCKIVFELFDTSSTLRTSEVLPEIKIIINNLEVYTGRGVVTSLVNVGTSLVCEARLDEQSFSFESLSSQSNGKSTNRFSVFLREWQKVYRVMPEFKVAVADMQTFLTDLRIWSDHVALEVAAAKPKNSIQTERQVVEELSQSMIPAFNSIHERLEEVSAKIDVDSRPVHQNFTARLLHPLVLCSPFASRTFQKPLGYAGDYEMVNMIVRDPFEGSSPFAKTLNAWFLDQWPAKAHRNRIVHLKRRLREECARGEREGRQIRILNLGCGPAREIQEFLAEDALSDYANFTLLDFNDETVQYTSDILNNLKQRHSRKTKMEIKRKSVHQVLKEGGRENSLPDERKYDFIYCAGLFDYLSDRTCKQLMEVFYGWLANGGLLTATNVDDCRPFRHMLEFILDWHLIYRDAKKGATLLPEASSPEWAHIEKDSTEVNVFIETRKPTL